MMRLSIACVAGCLFMTSVIAAPQDPPSDTTELKDEGELNRLENEIESLETHLTEVRELYFQEAIDFESDRQQLAIDTVVTKGWKDERYNDPVQEVVDRFSSDDARNVSTTDLSNAVSLVQVTTFDPERQVDLYMKVYMRCAEILADEDSEWVSAKRTRLRIIQRSLLSELRKTPDATGRQLLLEIQKPDVRVGPLLPLVSSAGESRMRLLPLLVELAKAGNEENRIDVLAVASDLADSLRDEKLQRRSYLSVRREIGALDERYVQYAKRLFARYDADKDQQLSRDEFGKMLSSPAAADDDQDGFITVSEYAAYLQTNARNRSGR